MRLLDQSVELIFAHSQHPGFHLAIFGHEKDGLPHVIGVGREYDGPRGGEPEGDFTGLLDMKESDESLLDAIDIGIYGAVVNQSLAGFDGDLLHAGEETVDDLIRRAEVSFLLQQLSDRFHLHTAL